MKKLPKHWFAEDALTLAPKLLGKIVKKGSCTGIIVETEAYMSDAASHAFRASPRSIHMRETYGHWYVYFTYGMHWCANVTVDKADVGAILIRAVEPIKGIPLMKKRRKTDNLHRLGSGPACFTQAFGITGSDNGLPLSSDFGIYDAPAIAPENIIASPRIGIREAIDLPWRFSVKDNPFVSC